MIKVIIVKIVKILSTNRIIRLIKKVLRQDRDFSTRLNYAYKKIREFGWIGLILLIIQQKIWFLNYKNKKEKQN